MATVRKATKLEGVDPPAFVLSGQLRIGKARKYKDPKDALTSLSKAERRKIRKALHRQGFGGLSYSTLPWRS